MMDGAVFDGDIGTVIKIFGGTAVNIRFDGWTEGWSEDEQCWHFNNHADDIFTITKLDKAPTISEGHKTSDKLELIKAVHEAIMEIVGSSNDQATVRLALEVFQATVNDETLPVVRVAWEPGELEDFVRSVREPIAVETPDEIDWSEAPRDAMYMARDEDGEAYFFRGEPSYEDCGEWLADGSVLCRASLFPSYKRGTCDWTDSLVKRPGVE